MAEPEMVEDDFYEFNIDAVSHQDIRLWVWSPHNPDIKIRVELLLNGSLVGQYCADTYREDLFRHGKGDGNHALEISISDLTSEYAHNSALLLELYASSPRRHLLVKKELVDGILDFNKMDAGKLQRSKILLAPLSVKASRLLNTSAFGVSGQSNSITVTKLFAPASSLLNKSDNQEKTSGFSISKYSDYVRYRFKVDIKHPIQLGSAEALHYLKWYLEAYSAMRKELRAPLSSQEIDHLNELIIVGGQNYHLSRVTYMFLLDNQSLLSGLDLRNIESYLSIVYWWSVERARSMYVEDCLVPASYQALLESCRSVWTKGAYPLSRFMEIFFSRHSELHFLNLDLKEDRALFYIVLLFNAVSQPSLLNYIPRVWLQKFTTPETEEAKGFKAACAMMFGSDIDIFDPHQYRIIINAVAYDLDSRRSLLISRSRDRILSAALRIPREASKLCHVQIIGPMRLASGLGQAARLSAIALKETEIEFSSYAFDLDNPAPVGFANDVANGEMVRPAVNIIHLNAESIPLAFSYLPDAFSTAYNIGYFFWELDSPANCHFLALDLLDEIWVSSQYGVDIYSPATSKPVINVGMAIEAANRVPREEAKTFLRQKTGIQMDEFTFMAAFDSFSFIQRKNPQAIVKAFKLAFFRDERVRLLLKTHNRDFVEDQTQLRYWQALNDEIASDPRIVIINETLTYNDLIRLKSGCDAYVSLHKSEGWGFGMAEAMNLGLPVVATAYSGNMEFCRPDTCWLVDFQLAALGPDDYIFVAPGQRWAEPNLQHAAEQMQLLYENPQERASRASAAKELIKTSFSATAIGARYASRLKSIFSSRGLDGADRSLSRNPSLTRRRSSPQPTLP